MRLTSTPTDWRALYPEVSKSDWRDWRWQQHVIADVDALDHRIRLTAEERRG